MTNRSIRVLVAFLLAACGDDFGSTGGEFGATPGGVKDMGLARELVANGRVPPPEAFLVEGMFSEHDLRVAGAPCGRTLCLRAALGVAPTLAGEASGWVQVGLSSTIDPATWERPSLTLIATVDVSGSMGWGYAGDPTPGEVSRRLLQRLAAQLGPQDRIAIITYGSSVWTPLPLTAGDRHDVVDGVIAGLGENGSTNLEAGLRVAYELAAEAEGLTAERRIVLFTDVRPNVGATSSSEFQVMVEAGAAQGVGITVMGMGLGLGQDLFAAMSHLRGGNAFSLFDFDDVDELLADEWPWFAAPIAYDLSLALTPGDGFDVAQSYGFPGGDGGGASLDVATVFLSERKGALLARLAPDAAGGSLAGLRIDGRLSYQPIAGEPVVEELVAAYGGQPLDDRGQYFQQPGVAAATALAVLVTAMRDAAEQYGPNRAAALATMRAAYDRFAADAAALGDPALAPEVELAADLVALMEAGAEQGDLY